LILMGAVALLSMQMTRTVDVQLAIIDQNYFSAYLIPDPNNKNLYMSVPLQGPAGSNGKAR